MRMSNLVASLLLILSLMIGQSSAYCDAISTKPTWKEFVDLLDAAVDKRKFAFPCAFTLSGNGCPSSGQAYRINGASSMNIVCGDFVGGGGDCSINCANTVFIVPAGKSLSLEGFTVRSARSSAIVVFGSLTVTSSDFVGNKHNQDGGAIRAAKGSKLTVKNSSFKDNKGRNGGAILAMGNVELSNVDLSGNQATNGGAIFVGPNSRCVLKSCDFQSNKASQLGPAVYSSTRSSSASSVSGCNNGSCDGTENKQGCEPFDKACSRNKPTPRPVVRRTPRPSRRPVRRPPTRRPVRRVPTMRPVRRIPTMRPVRTVAMPPTMRPVRTNAMPPTMRPIMQGVNQFMRPTMRPVMQRPPTMRPVRPRTTGMAVVEPLAFTDPHDLYPERKQLPKVATKQGDVTDDPNRLEHHRHVTPPQDAASRRLVETSKLNLTEAVQTSKEVENELTVVEVFGTAT